MDRLTNRFDDGEAFCEKFGVIEDVGVDQTILKGELVDKLAEYEDAEEQGLLLKLPCKVGTNYWIFNTDYLNWNEYKIEYVKCVDYRINFYNPYLEYHPIDNPFVSRVIFKGEDDRKYSYCFKDIPTHVFLTKEEAENALEKANIEKKIEALEELNKKAEHER